MTTDCGVQTGICFNSLTGKKWPKQHFEISFYEIQKGKMNSTMFQFPLSTRRVKRLYSWCYHFQKNKL